LDLRIAREQFPAAILDEIQRTRIQRTNTVSYSADFISAAQSHRGNYAERFCRSSGNTVFGVSDRGK